MIISKIIEGDNVYYNLHAEQTVTGAFLDEPGMGIFEEILTQTTLDNVIKDVEDSDYKIHNVILSFENIHGCQNNIKKKIISLIKICKTVILTNIKKEIIEEIEVGIFNNKSNSSSEKQFNTFYLSNEATDIVEIDSRVLFKKVFLSNLKEHIEKDETNGILHHSSSVYLTSYINIKSFIVKEKEFFLYAVYQLAFQMKTHWGNVIQASDINEKPTLICQNLNSSYISSILSSLLKLDILILDQIGPINKLYSTLDKKIEQNKKYIVISDLVCLGTEIKIAKSLIEFLGGEYVGNVSIIRIETILPQHKKFTDTESVCTISNENNVDINYQIKTALNLSEI